MKIVALITARGKSKRLPGKNLLSLNGYPLLYYSIKAALQSKEITSIVVSSDDDEIGRVALAYGAHYLPRPASISGDESTSSEALIHFSQAMQLDSEDIIVLLQPTSPLRPRDLIDAIIEYANNNDSEWDSLTTVSRVKTKFGTMKNGYYRPYNYTRGQRSQDMEDVFYVDNGLVYLTKVKTLEAFGNMYGDRVIGYLTEGAYSEVDIDTLYDFKSAEQMYLILREKDQLI